MNTAFWVTYPLRNCLKMRKNSNMFAVIFNHSQQTWSFTDDVKSNSSSPFYHSLDSDLKALLWKVQLRSFVYGQFAEFFFSGFFQNGGQESKEEENLRIFSSLSALESQLGKVVTARIKRISIRLLYVTRK